VFPDFERWPLAHVQVLFDVHPATNILLPSDPEDASDGEPAPLSPAQAESLAARAVIKSFSVPMEKAEPEKFAAYLVPTWQGLKSISAGALDDEGPSSSSGGGSAEYHWVREYHYEAKPDESVQDNMIFFFNNDKVTYAPLNAKLLMQKKKARGLQDRGVELVQDISRPSAISLSKRPLSDQEHNQRAQTRRKLEHPCDDIGEL